MRHLQSEGKENRSFYEDDSGAGDYQCPVCKKNFASKYVLLTHRKMTHAETKAFYCDHPGCKVKCATSLRLKLHKQKAHGGELRCYICFFFSRNFFHNLRYNQEASRCFLKKAN